jgi:glutathione-regulated potassium-efflux system ancillary protein KefF
VASTTHRCAAQQALTMADILILAAHPQLEHSRATRSAMQAVQQLGSEHILLRDLYALYPDYLIDVPTEQALLAQARLVVWLHPVHWYSMPPLLKLWLDEVLSFGWAYGPGGQALKGKDLWLVASTGGPEESYHPSGHNRYFFDAFLPPYEQTAALCGMRWLPPLVQHGALRSPLAELQAHAEVFVHKLRTWPHWPELESLQAGTACEVPADARRQTQAQATNSTKS